MGLEVSVLLLAVGALLVWGVDPTAAGFDLNAVGVILLSLGTAGGVLSLFYWSSWGGLGWKGDPRGRGRR